MNAAAHGVWFTERAGVAGTVYHMALGIWFDGHLNVPAVEQACAAVLARHPALSRAVGEDAHGLRFVDAAEKVPLTHGEHSDERVRQEIERPYRLERGPLARFTLLRERPDRHLLLFTAHHLVFDGMSKDLLVRDLAAAYSGHELAPLPDVVPGPAAAPERIGPLPQPVLPDLRSVPEAALPGTTVDFTTAGVDVGGLTRFEVLLAAIHVLLARYGNAGLSVSLGMSTRTAQTKDAIGLFVNEAPLTVAPATGGFRGYALELRRRLRALDRHRPVSGPRPAPALTPVSVGYRRRAPEPAFAGVATSVQWSLFSGSARNALHFQIVDGPDAMAVSLQHSPAAVPTEAVARIGAHLRAILDAVAADADADIAALALEAEPARHGTPREHDPHTTVPHLFAEQVRRRPHDVAVVDAGRKLTYAELDAASAELAERLPTGALVAIRLGRGRHALTAMLAVMRAGSAYLPVDPAYPPARQQLILDDARPSAVISDDGLELPATGEGVADAAYVMYTSGSTGTPKGVVVPPAALANLLLAMADVVGSTPADRWLALTSLSFDISGLELLLPLVTGGRVVIASETGAADGRAVADLIRAEAVTHVQATPSGWRALLEADLPPGLTALCGGEALPLDLARQLRPRVARLVNVYGPTETTIWSTTDEVPDEPQQITIGRPIANTQVYLVDDQRQPVPAGVWGELWLGGRGVAQGYLRRPELTAQRFLPNPFGPGTVYRTGDVCRWTPDGRLEFRGRTDSQIKIRGHRVEPEEIETRLREHPAVEQAAVALQGDQLAAHIVARGPAPEPAELRRHLAEILPPALVPGLWSVLAALPLTANGKLDRAALPAVTPPRAPSVDEGDQLTAALRQIWQEVLSIDDIGLHEDLFDLGGHSLTITRITARIMQRLGVDVPLDVFFDTPTIAEIAAYIRESA
ncbi:amino acid adenylation domain-containing protein [Catellatospora methionotrophica]|uniref:non-ribosomal peptide synthetase family protein n=1 Tax=Catellatospora methionotrophica TaxID=121620 RepID=UPI0033C9B745